MTTICAMQPYLFPYLPYFQLAASVDAFWVLDDVQFIRRGWMNRNQILLDGQPHRISFPVSHGRQGDLICDKTLPDTFNHDLSRIIDTITRAYRHAPRQDQLQALLAPLPGRSWARFLDLALETLQRSFASLGLQTPIRLASSLNLSAKLRGQDRILAICAATGATTYVNPAGGRLLYDADAFTTTGVQLRFLQGKCPAYPQSGVSQFVPGLSILDPIAHLSPQTLKTHLTAYDLSPG